MVFIHIILHKLIRLLASFYIYYHYYDNEFNVNEIKKYHCGILDNPPRFVVKLPEKKKIPDYRFLCSLKFLVSLNERNSWRFQGGAVGSFW